MPRVNLSPEAAGTLLAMKCLATIHFYEPNVAAELTSHGLAEIKDGLLVITQAGKVVRLEANGYDAAPRRRYDRDSPPKDPPVRDRRAGERPADRG